MHSKSSAERWIARDKMEVLTFFHSNSDSSIALFFNHIVPTKNMTI